MLGLVLMMSCSDDLTAADINRVPSLCLKELRCLTPQADFKLLLYGLDSLPNEQPTPIPYLERTLVQTVSQQASPQTTSPSVFTQPESLLGYILAAIFAVFTGGNVINGWQANRRKLDLSSPEVRAQILSLVEQTIVISLLKANNESPQKMPIGSLVQELLARLNELQSQPVRK